MTKTLLFIPSAFILLTVAGCGAQSPVDTGADDDTEAASSDLTLRACPTHKITFTRKNGCQNDGSVEFCIPANDARLKARISALDPEITFVGSSGRARCDVATELLGMYPTAQEPGGECLQNGALTRAAWRDICAIAAERKVRQVVPTWYE